eukprot:8676785-Heterocapsa_arctica.AAC.1
MACSNNSRECGTMLYNNSKHGEHADCIKHNIAQSNNGLHRSKNGYTTKPSITHHGNANTDKVVTYHWHFDKTGRTIKISRASDYAKGNTINVTSRTKNSILEALNSSKQCR